MKQIVAKIMILSSLLVILVFMPFFSIIYAFDFTDIATIGAAYMTSLGFHEIGHDIVASETGGGSHKMNFFIRKNGNFFLGLSTYKDIPEESKLPYFIGGERMADITFEYALQSYRKEPTTFNKALIFFSYTDFLFYTLYANYISPGNDWHDPNLIREELGCSKEMLFSFVLGKALLNTYRIFNEDANFTPVITADRNSAVFMIRFELW